jgi:hypothetical protein
MHRNVINEHTTLLHHFLNMAKAQWVASPTVAKELLAKRDAGRSEHLTYVRSNGIAGKLTLTTGEKFDVVRLGFRSARDYVLAERNMPTRHLYEIEYAHRLADKTTAGLNDYEKRQWEFKFRSGETIVGVYGLSNEYREVVEDRMRVTTEAFQGAQSVHIFFVLKKSNGLVIQARIAANDIAALDVTGSAIA